MSVTDYVRTVKAENSYAATDAVTLMARKDNLTVRTVKSVRLIAPPVQTTPARYRVTLAVTR